MIFAYLILAVAVILFIVFMERAQRRLLIVYPKRQVGNRMMGGENSFLPLKINVSGVIPPIFASSLLLLPATAVGFLANAKLPELGAMAARRRRVSSPTASRPSWSPMAP